MAAPILKFRNLAILPSILRLNGPRLTTSKNRCFHAIQTKSLINRYRHRILDRRFHPGVAGGLRHGDYEWQDPKSPEDIVNITYITKDNERIEVQGKVGDNVMYLAHRHEIEVEGACEASLACCTCHVILSDTYYDALPEATDEEEDMLDLAPFLTSTSRLSCQIILTKELEGMEVKLPQATRNFYVDGHVPQPH